jgi:hypothetical protein
MPYREIVAFTRAINICMKTYIMLIMLLHLDPMGQPYTTALQESPMREYSTQSECDTAAESKRAAMLKSSRSYPDLGIVDVKIQCVDSSEAEFDPAILKI